MGLVLLYLKNALLAGLKRDIIAGASSDSKHLILLFRYNSTTEHSTGNPMDAVDNTQSGITIANNILSRKTTPLQSVVSGDEQIMDMFTVPGIN